MKNGSFARSDGSRPSPGPLPRPGLWTASLLKARSIAASSSRSYYKPLEEEALAIASIGDARHRSTPTLFPDPSSFSRIGRTTRTRLRHGMPDPEAGRESSSSRDRGAGRPIAGHPPPDIISTSTANRRCRLSSSCTPCRSSRHGEGSKGHRDLRRRAKAFDLTIAREDPAPERPVRLPISRTASATSTVRTLREETQRELEEACSSSRRRDESLVLDLRLNGRRPRSVRRDLDLSCQGSSSLHEGRNRDRRR